MILYILLHISVSIRETILESATFFNREKKIDFYMPQSLSLSHFDYLFIYLFTALAHWQFLKLCS